MNVVLEVKRAYVHEQIVRVGIIKRFIAKK